MLIILAISGWVLLLGALCFILRDFMRFIVRRTFSVWRRPGFIDFGEYATTWYGVIVMAVSGFLFYKFTMALTAYVLSADLITFFRMMRGVFTVKSVEQSPFMPEHIAAGLLGQTFLQFLACFVIYRGLRGFMCWVNKRYTTPSYTEGDMLYYGFFAVLVFMALEIFSYSQHMPGVSGTVHLFYLAMANTGLICYFFAISHLHLMANGSYRRSLPRYVQFDRRIKRIVIYPVLTVSFTWGIGILLHLPLYLGTQFLEKNWLVVVFALFSGALFYAVIRKILSRGFNYFGAIMFFDAEKPLAGKMDGTMRSIPLVAIKTPHRIPVHVIAICMTGLLLITQPKSFLLLVVILMVAAGIILAGHLLVYGTGLCLSLGRSLFSGQRRTVIDRRSMIHYLKVTGEGLARNMSPAFTGIVGIFVLMSIFPKNYDFSPEENYVNTVVDAHHQPLMIGRFDGNACTPASREDIPEFMVRCLQIQEDRDFSDQQSWWPQWSNWHGLSLASFYRMLSGTGGGSNLNMQLIKNEAFPGTFPRDFQRKYTEMLSAYQLSLRLTPDQIITRYVNQVGMIGGVGHQGAVMASYKAFDRPLAALNELEQLYLIVSLKRSTLFKAGENYIAYYEARYFADDIKEALLEQARDWQENDLLEPATVVLLAGQQLRFRERHTSDEVAVTTREFLKRRMPAALSGGFTYLTTLEFNNQQRITEAVDKFEQFFRDELVSDGYRLYSAGLVVDVRTGKVIGHHGGEGVTDLTTLAGGSPMGSIIKPFILLEMMESGHDPLNLKLYDGKVKGRFTPNNYSRTYSGMMKGVNEIISKSLNAPMVNVRLLQDPLPLFMQVERRFSVQGISADKFLDLENATKAGEFEVNYPLGSRNMTLFDIAQAYQTLLNDGIYRELSVFEEAYDPESASNQVLTQRVTRIFKESNAHAMKEAMHHSMLSGGTGTHINHLLPEGRKFYAKTGTSDEAIHGYTVLSDGRLLVVTYVTYGKISEDHLELNQTPPIPHGSGVRSAGVLAAYLYQALESTAPDKPGVRQAFIN